MQNSLTALGISLVLTGVLVGCAGSEKAQSAQMPEANEVIVTGNPGGAFSGTAGSGWTADEVKDQIGTNLCNGAAPGNFTARKQAGGGLSFSGGC